MGSHKTMFDRVGTALLLSLVEALTIYTVVFGFEASDSLQIELAVLCLVAGVLAFGLELSMSAKKGRVIGSVVVAAIILCALVALGMLESNVHSAAIIQDVSGNVFLCALVASITWVPVFALARSRFGCVALLGGVVVASCLLELLYQEHHWLVYLCDCSAALALLLARLFSKSRHLTAGKSMLVAFETFVLSAGAFAIAFILFGVLIQPFNPPVVFHPIFTTEHVTVKDEYVRGVGDKTQVENPDLKSNDYLDASIKSSKLSDEESESSSSAAQGLQGDSDVSSGGAQANLQTWGTAELSANDVDKEEPWWRALMLILALLLLVLVILLRVAWRRHWLEKTKKLPSDAACRAIYERILHNLAVLGYPIATGVTPLEHAKSSAIPVDLAVGGDITLGELAGTYCEVVFGLSKPEPSCVEAMADFLANSYGRARAMLGLRRYLFKWWFLK